MVEQDRHQSSHNNEFVMPFDFKYLVRCVFFCTFWCALACGCPGRAPSTDVADAGLNESGEGEGEGEGETVLPDVPETPGLPESPTATLLIDDPFLPPAGGTTTVCWQAEHADDCRIQQDDQIINDHLESSGCFDFAASQSATLQLSCTGDWGTALSTRRLVVGAGIARFEASQHQLAARTTVDITIETRGLHCTFTDGDHRQREIDNGTVQREVDPGDTLYLDCRERADSSRVHLARLELPEAEVPDVVVQRVFARLPHRATAAVQIANQEPVPCATTIDDGHAVVTAAVAPHTTRVVPFASAFDNVDVHITTTCPLGRVLAQDTVFRGARIQGLTVSQQRLEQHGLIVFDHPNPLGTCYLYIFGALWYPPQPKNNIHFPRAFHLRREARFHVRCEGDGRMDADAMWLSVGDGIDTFLIDRRFAPGGGEDVTVTWATTGAASCEVRFRRELLRSSEIVSTSSSGTLSAHVDDRLNVFVSCDLTNGRDAAASAFLYARDAQPWFSVTPSDEHLAIQFAASTFDPYAINGFDACDLLIHNHNGTWFQQDDVARGLVYAIPYRLAQQGDAVVELKCHSGDPVLFTRV